MVVVVSCIALGLMNELPCIPNHPRLRYAYDKLAEIKEYIRWRTMLGKLPTGDDWIFLIGHAHKTLGKSSEEFWKMLREYYPIAPPLHTAYLGPTLIFVIILEADEAEAIISSMKNLPKAKVYEFIKDWLEDGLLTSTGNHWQTRRKILTPAFHFTILREFVEIFTKETVKLTKEIEENYLNKPVDVTPIISNFTLLTINETSMGTKLDLETKEGLTYKNSVYRMGEVLYNRWMKPWLHYKPIFDKTSLGKEAKQLVKILHNFTDNVIKNRAKNFKVFKVEENDKDEFSMTNHKVKRPLLDILLNAKLQDNSIDEKGIREEVNTFMFEGHDTTAMSLSFTCMLLACHKEIQDELYQEITQILGTDLTKDPTYADLQNMTFMERCIKESLRLYPSVSFIGRKLDSDVTTQYGVIPRGTTCFIQIYDIHRNPKYWPNPEKFDPSRHLPENSHGRHTFAYIPFSAGPRNCIGQRFAMLEMKSAICGILRKFSLEPVDTPESIVMLQDIILRSRDGVKVKFVPRNQ